VRFEYVFFAVFALAVGGFAWRFVRGGSLAAAMLGGRITREIGEIQVESRMGSSTSVRIYDMAIDGQSRVGLVVVSKAFLAASMAPVKLTRAQARELAALLQRAVAD